MTLVERDRTLVQIQNC
jgi:phospholipid-translocating ATPase